MGRGDKKTKKGKIAIGSYGKKRPHNPKKEVAAAEAPAAAPAEKPTDKAKKPSA